ncbi:acylneuraminate cytidylyltransferase family protein [Lysinibacillus louembei]|uniref:Acylneuraminate cytidylyltransferase family protein n=1 Tax=Lysinibacillus louembei TaxID=1470088 RepID=A0ABZ0RVY8_9BACI|nr:acylneuraminate cytidylyltransferase family protein [Lysinibacillus louembei]WPK12399.1 acylneuraminate cytidylyltransferase family protein [Lysinibacillus louembei]
MKPKILAIIPARGGSKGVPRKNIRDFAGKPLIAWTIEEAKKSKYLSRTILSSEDEEIIAVAEQYDCEVPFVRPLILAQDDTPGIVPVLHAIEQCPGFDYVVLLQPTSPLRTVEDIDGCIEKILYHQADFCVSVTEPEKSPYWMYTMNEHEIMKPLFKLESIPSRRQDLRKVYALNGAIYVAKVDKLLQEKSFLTANTLGYVMSEEKSFDIDNLRDFKVCEYLHLENLDS